MFDAVLRRQSCQIINRFGVVHKKLSHADSSLVQSQLRIKDLVRENCSRRRNKFKKYFIENLFINKFEETVLEYPGLHKIKEVELLEKQCRLAEKFITKSNDNEIVSSNKSDGAIATLKHLQLTGFKLPLQQNGYGHLNSEYTAMLESLAVNTSLAKAVSENEDFGIELIKLFGNDSQKEKYLQKLASGESLVCFAHVESEPLTLEVPILNTSAVLTSDGQGYIVSGKKNWVCNAKYADTIIVSANVATINSDGQNKANPTLFLVDKNLEGIKVSEPIRKLGLNGVDICEVTFNEVMIPSDCVLGEISTDNKIMEQIQIIGKLSHSVQSVRIMKKLVNMAIDYCIQNNFLKKSMSDRDLFKYKIEKLVTRLYSVESMTYLVAGRMDMFVDADVFLESHILKIYTSECLQYILQECISLVGADIFSNDDFNQIIEESQYYACCEEKNDRLRMVLSKAGCKHVMEYNNEIGALKKALKNVTRQNVLNFVGLEYPDVNPTNKLKGYLHLMFKEESNILEDCVFSLKATADLLLKKFGENIFDRHLELNLLADLVIDIYAMTAILGRASRAYCLCVVNHETDRSIATSEVKRLHSHFYEKKEEIIHHANSSDLRKLSSKLVDSNISRYRHHPVVQNLLLQNKRQSEKI